MPSLPEQVASEVDAECGADADVRELSLANLQIRAGLVEEIDFVMQALLELPTVAREKQAYRGQVAELRPYLMEATIEVMKQRGARLVVSSTEQAIFQTLGKMLPGAAASYEQVLRDINTGDRISWRGTGAELREVLREVIDHLAPDEQVTSAAGFQLERERTGPTQQQKVRFILRARKNPSGAVAVARDALATADELIGALARSTYTRGSISTHTSEGIQEIRSLKRYVEALLAELLEIA